MPKLKCPGTHKGVASGSESHSTPALPAGDDLLEAIAVAINEAYRKCAGAAAAVLAEHQCPPPCLTFYRLKLKTRQPIPRARQPNKRVIATVTCDWSLDVVCKRPKDLPAEVTLAPGETANLTALRCPGLHKSAVIECATTPPLTGNDIDEFERRLEADAKARAQSKALAATIGAHCAGECTKSIRIREVVVTHRSIQISSTATILAGGPIYYGFATACAYVDVLCD